MTFKELDLKNELLTAVEELGFESPTSVQEKTIPFVLNQTADLVALAQTGTGKTAAYGLPLMNMIDADKQYTQMLVLAPTRELCVQIAKDLSNYAKFLKKIKVVAVYGGEDIRRQLKQLDMAPQIIVATPGRLIDLIDRRKIDLSGVRFLVLDEADEMLNMGFKDAIETILKKTPDYRRTLLFSATMPAEISRIAKQYMKNFEEITIGVKNSGSDNVEHIYYVAPAKQRYLVLKRIVDLNPDIYGIVFCRTRQETKDVADQLMRDGYNADALHGDLSQIQRDSVMNRFRIRNVQLLVATDVAARGLDVSDLTHVINYNLPDDSEVYTHRSGRTGRVNKKGVSVSIIHSRERHRIRELESMLKKKFQQNQIPNGLEVCKKQLFHFIAKMQSVEINDEQIEPYMQSIESQLAYLSKDELLKRFVSLEFNRFLEYYRDAEDLNYYEKPSGRSERSDRSGRGERSERSGHSERGERGERGARNGKRVRLKMNMGQQDRLDPRRFLKIINDVTGDKSINVGDIEITGKFTFFDIYEDQADKVLSAFANETDVSVSEAKGNKSAEGGKPRGGGGGYKRKSNNQGNGSGYGGYSGGAGSDKPWRKQHDRKDNNKPRRR